MYTAIDNNIDKELALKKEETKQKELELEMKKIELEILKLTINKMQIHEEIEEENIQVVQNKNKKKTPKRIRRENILNNVSSDEEKQKFINWVTLNVQKRNIDDSALNWITLLTNYLGYRTNPMISSTFRVYFQEYIGKEYEYKNFKYKGTTYNGWRNLILK